MSLETRAEAVVEDLAPVELFSGGNVRQVCIFTILLSSCWIGYRQINEQESQCRTTTVPDC